MVLNSIFSFLIPIVLCTLILPTVAQYDDVRCKCVCPLKAPKVNSTDPGSRRIFVKSFHEPSSCKCENVLPQEMQTEKFCQRCDCQWQRRNTGTIKVIVIMIVCMISLLVIYMVFLLCLDPLLNWRQHTQYEPQVDTSSVTEIRPPPRTITPTTAAIIPDPPLTPTDPLEDIRIAGDSRQRPGVIWRVREEMRRVQGQQEKWMGAVEQQRKRIYDTHSFLN